MRSLLAAALVVAGGGCSKEASDASEAATPQNGRVRGRLIPIVDSTQVAGVAPETLVGAAREAFAASRGGPEASTQALEATPGFGPPSPSNPPVAIPEEPRFAPGEAVVRVRGGLDQALARLEAEPSLAAYRFEVGAWATREILGLRFRRAKAPEIVPTATETLEVNERIAASGIFEFAHPNHYRFAQTVPDDEHYERTWHYHLLDMEAAWSITTGSPEVVIAVIDSGARPHEDLSRLLPGYDFVSHFQLAGDGDGRDPDPSPVDGRGSAYHGQHVAGTIGADANNGIGIPGMDWQAKLLPIRALGVWGYGTTVDIVASIAWAVGEEVPGVPPNPHPAQVLNLSLGGSRLEPSEQEAIHLARARGATVVVAAGNEDIDARHGSFSGYQGVITVGATGFRGDRAPYSNFGPAVDVMAPGGDLSSDWNGDELPDGVYSLWFHERGAVDGYRMQHGTSMAAPHVAGLVGLMKALDPSLVADDVERILRETSNREFQCREGCGAGLVDPARALQAVLDQEGSAPQLHLPLERLDLGPRSWIFLPIENTGTSPLAWHASVEGEDAQNFRLPRPGGTVPPGATRTIEIEAEPGLLREGRYRTTLRISSSGGEGEVELSFTAGPGESEDLGVARILAFALDEAGEVLRGGEAETDASLGYGFELPIEAGAWYLAAMIDRDGDGALGADDLLGFWPQNAEPLDIEVLEEGIQEGMEFILEPLGPAPGE